MSDLEPERHHLFIIMSKNVPARKAFDAWLANNGIKSAASRACYLRGDLYPGTNLSYFELAANFMVNGEPSLALTVLDDWYDEIESSTTNVTNRKSYWAKTYQFFLTEQTKLIASNEPLSIDSAILRAIRKKFAKEVSSKNCSRIGLSQLDGMNHLISILGENNFIKLAIESSYFFDPDAVKARFDYIQEIFENGGDLAARESSSHPSYPNITIVDDTNGNSNVYSLINKEFGYNLNQVTEKKPILNVVVSHVWGNAIDPQYFTALWNIVLIPAWANHLMDKESAQAGSLASKLRATFKALCLKLYDMPSFEWEKLPMGSCPTVGVVGDVRHAQYSLQVIQPSNRKSGIKQGRILIKQIKV